eukprot:8779741-Alexandrium_andersonii.AAC.1
MAAFRQFGSVRSAIALCVSRAPFRSFMRAHAFCVLAFRHAVWHHNVLGGAFALRVPVKGPEQAE